MIPKRVISIIIWYKYRYDFKQNTSSSQTVLVKTHHTASDTYIINKKISILLKYKDRLHIGMICSHFGEKRPFPTAPDFVAWAKEICKTSLTSRHRSFKCVRRRY